MHHRLEGSMARGEPTPNEPEVYLRSPGSPRNAGSGWRRRSRTSACRSDPLYVCQATQLAVATKPLPWWKPGQYVEDYRSGNVPLSDIVARLAFLLYAELVSTGVGLGSAFRWIYNKIQSVRGGERLSRAPRTPPGRWPDTFRQRRPEGRRCCAGEEQRRDPRNCRRAPRQQRDGFPSGDDALLRQDLPCLATCEQDYR